MSNLLFFILRVFSIFLNMWTRRVADGSNHSSVSLVNTEISKVLEANLRDVDFVCIVVNFVMHWSIRLIFTSHKHSHNFCKVKSIWCWHRFVLLSRDVWIQMTAFNNTFCRAHLFMHPLCLFILVCWSNLYITSSDDPYRGLLTLKCSTYRKHKNRGLHINLIPVCSFVYDCMESRFCCFFQIFHLIKCTLLELFVDLQPSYSFRSDNQILFIFQQYWPYR